MSKKCFVISPIGSPESNTRKKADELLNYLIRPVLTELGYQVIRADELPHPGSITQDIVENIDQSDLVIAIISGHNPNVFYELAVRNAIEKPVILMSEEGDEKLPFDIQGKRVITYCNTCNYLSSSEDEKVQNVKEELKKQVESAEENPKRASSSILSAHLHLPKRLNDHKKELDNCEKEHLELKSRYDSNEIKTKKQLILLSSAFVFVLIIGLFVYPLNIQNSHHDLLREQQLNTIELVTYEKIQNLIDHSNVYTMMFTNGYNIGDNSTQFVNEIIEEYRHIDLFKPNVKTGDVLAYVYVMGPGPNCEFKLYSYLPHMTRADGRILEACIMSENTDLFLTSMYPTTGTKSFASSLVKRIDLNADDDKYDMIIGSAIDWDRFSNDIQRAITLENTRFVLVDAKDFVVVDCDENSCENIKAQALTEEGFSKDSVAKKYDSDEYDIYQNHADPILLNNSYLEKYDIRNSILLDGWKIYMHYK